MFAALGTCHAFGKGTVAFMTCVSPLFCSVRAVHAALMLVAVEVMLMTVMPSNGAMACFLVAFAAIGASHNRSGCDG